MTRHFFATAEDLLPIFDLVDRKYRLAYTLMGRHESSELRTVAKGADIPTLRDVMEAPNAIACPSYLVTVQGAPIHVREVPQESGGTRYAVDQLINPDSITFSHGGFFSPEILLLWTDRHCFGFCSCEDTVSRLLRGSCQVVRPNRSILVGPQANELLRKGCRLTMGANSPKEYDLAV
jgi:hypothetical protein